MRARRPRCTSEVEKTARADRRLVGAGDLESRGVEGAGESRGVEGAGGSRGVEGVGEGRRRG